MLVVGDETIARGEKRLLQLSVGRLFDFTELHIPVHVVRGRFPGPVLAVLAAIHGDEINGIEVVRRVLRLPSLKKMRGTLIAVPIANIRGFNAASRYLPDRRDLNRVFPGSPEGSFGARIADILMKEIIRPPHAILDLHTGAIHRPNFPQVRAHLKDRRSREIAMAFGAPLVLNSEIREGSLRQSAHRLKKAVLVYEAGEALRLDDRAVTVGVNGVRRVMKHYGMIEKGPRLAANPLVANESTWLRAPASGLFKVRCRLGAPFKAGALVGEILDPRGLGRIEVRTEAAGVALGMNRQALVHRGDALIHMADFSGGRPVKKTLQRFEDQLDEQSAGAVDGGDI